MTADRVLDRRAALSSSSVGASLAGLELSELWPRRHAPRAREELVRRFLPLARQLALRYRNRHEPFDDLVQVASLGLLGAIDRFDPDRGISFPSFAIPTVLGELKRHFRDTGWSAHVPRGAQQMALRVDQATRELSADTGQAPRVGALADHLGVSIDDVLLGLEAGTARYSASIDAPTHSDLDEPLTLADTVGGDDERIGLLETALWLKAAITQLPYVERRALTLRLGQNMRQVDIAQQMNCSQMQVSRLLRRASIHLRSLASPPISLK